MKRICKNCGFVNNEADPRVTATCPTCGSVYARSAVAAARARANTETTDTSAIGSILHRIGWLVALLGGLAGLVQLAFTFTDAESAPQQAAGAGLALALAAIPYCIARAIQMLITR